MTVVFSMRARPSATGAARIPELWIDLNNGAGNAPSRPATDADKETWRSEYAAFVASQAPAKAAAEPKVQAKK